MRISFLALLLHSIVSLSLSAPSPKSAPHPKLAVVISLDQFPYEYLPRFQPYFSENGINYLLSHGADFTNARYEHAATKTAPGHASFMTGAYAHINGITSNNWYDRRSKKRVNAVEDGTVQLFGSSAIGRSPKNLLTSTFGDMLRLSTNFRSKVISFSNKDRSAILMGGKFGKAFWFEGPVVATSNYYYTAVPEWLKTFNASGSMERFMGQTWSESQPAIAAKICDRDDAPYEDNVLGFGKSFPHLLPGKLQGKANPAYYDLLTFTPYATEVLLDAALKGFVAESLGTRGVTDMICIGISATDELGHVFGPASHEVFDDALRTDSMLASFLAFLDQKVGLANCVIVLTSDHGISHIPEYIRSKSPRFEAGRVGLAEMTRQASKALDAAFAKDATGTKWVEQIIDSEIYLDREVLRQKNVTLGAAVQVLKDSLSALPVFASVYTRDEIQHSGALDRFGLMVRNSYRADRSGDVICVLKPFYLNGGDTVGTSHGQPEDYDTHVPLIFCGTMFKQGKYRQEVSPIDLAPTMSEALQIEYPPSREGRVLYEAIR
jgi:predicted AlkP superfamily pyrophosphatase or phosphodiesterase